MEYKNEFPTMIFQRRRTSYTTRMLRLAIIQPNCVILSRTQNQADHLKHQYLQLRKKEFGWFRRLWWKIIFRKAPIFMSSMNLQNLKGCNYPIIPDNSLFSPFY